MAWYPGADRHNIPPGPSDPPIQARIICMHTMAGWIQGAENRFKDGSGIEAHFGVAMDGRCWQWRDTAFQADAQAAGNGYCISVETEDGGHPETPWTPRQFQVLVDLLTWLGHEHAIPMRLVRTTDDRGIGYHRQFPSWNPHNHSCPGDVRLRQLATELLPALQGADADMTNEQAAQLTTVARQSQAVYDALIVPGTTSPEQTVNLLFDRVRTIEKVVTTPPEPLEPIISEPVTIDLDALADKVADKLAARLAE